jgi:hypothetical protein
MIGAVEYAAPSEVSTVRTWTTELGVMELDFDDVAPLVAGRVEAQAVDGQPPGYVPTWSALLDLLTL